jgi:hypothetical protein
MAVFVMSKITIAPEGNMLLNLADGRSGQMFWLENRAGKDGTTNCGLPGDRRAEVTPPRPYRAFLL